MVLLWTADVALSQLEGIHDAMFQCLWGTKRKLISVAIIASVNMEIPGRTIQLNRLVVALPQICVLQGH